jgi:3-methyladenine DNA glycosylase AlkD
MEEWVGSEDLWLARTAILHQGRYRERTDAAFLFAACLRRAGDPEFFIRKAIGWALRDYARVDPEAVRRFVTDHAQQLSGLSKREAMKHLGGWPPPVEDPRRAGGA